MKEKTCIIIGSGIAGLAAAVRLQLAGNKVTVIEANDYPGGKLTAFSVAGYRFDAGPSLFTMPFYVDELFQLAGRNPRDYFNYLRLEESCRYFWDDHTGLTAWADTRKFAAEAEKLSGVDAERILKKLRKSKKLYETAGRIFLERPLHKLRTWLSMDVLRTLTHLPSLGVFTTMHRDNERQIGHPKLVQLFNRYATYNGSDPYRAPGILNMIPHFEHGIGTFFPQGGMHSITLSIYRLALDLGVEFRFNEKVSQIEYHDGRASGVISEKGRYYADKVISNMDILPTYRQLLKGLQAPERTLNSERSSSALIFYWGINRSFEELGLHNIFFSERYKDEFQAIFKEETLFNDPTIYVNITSKHLPDDAPQGCENWFVMINVPQHRGQNWDALVPEYRNIVLKKLSARLRCDISKHIAAESVLNPSGIEQNTSSAGGSLYGSSSNNRYAAFLRHRNESSRLKDLYFCGGSVHPGGGIPLCLLSAKIVSELAKN